MIFYCEYPRHYSVAQTLIKININYWINYSDISKFVFSFSIGIYNIDTSGGWLCSKKLLLQIYKHYIVPNIIILIYV